MPWSQRCCLNVIPPIGGFACHCVGSAKPGAGYNVYRSVTWSAEICKSTLPKQMHPHARRQRCRNVSDVFVSLLQTLHGLNHCPKQRKTLAQSCAHMRFKTGVAQCNELMLKWSNHTPSTQKSTRKRILWKCPPTNPRNVAK